MGHYHTMKNLFHARTILFLTCAACLVMLPACAVASPVPTMTTSPSSTVSPLPTSTRTALPTVSATVTKTRMATSTHTPTVISAPTRSSTPTQFVTTPLVGEGTSIPVANAPITPANASQVVQLARLGIGTNNDMAYSPDGSVLAVASSTGIYLYDNDQKLIDILPTDQFVNSIAFSPDGEIMAASVPVGNIQIWRWKDRQLLKTIHVNDNYESGYAEKLNFSPKGDSIGFVFNRAYPQGDVFFYVIQVESEEVLFGRVYSHYPRGFRFSPDGSLIYIVDGGITVDRLSNGEFLGSLTSVGADSDPLNNLAFSLDGKFMVGSNQKTIYLFHVNDVDPYASFDVPIDIYNHWFYSANTCRFGPSGGGVVVQNYALSPGNQFIAIDDGKGGFQIRRSSNGTLVKSKPGTNVINHTERYISTILYHPHQPFLAVSYSDGQIEIYNSGNLQLVGAIIGHTIFTSIAFSQVRPDGSVYLASGAADTFIRIWSLPSGSRVATIEGSADSVTFSPDGNFLAYGSRDWTINLIRLTDSKRYPPQPGHLDYVEGLAFSPDGKTLVSGSPDCTLKIWQVIDGRLSLQHTVGGGDPYIDSVFNVAYSPDGTWVAVSYDEGLFFYNTRTQEIRNLEERAHSISISPDGRYFAITFPVPGSFGDDFLLRVYELSTMRMVKEWPISGRRVVYSPDGKLFALGTNMGTIQLVDADSGEIIQTLSGAALPTGGSSYPVVTNLHFSPDGRFLASTSNGVIRLWGVPKD
jgi:WD40 repeat protein